MIQQKSHLKTHIEKQHPGKKGLLKKALANHNKVKIINREVEFLSGFIVICFRWSFYYEMFVIFLEIISKYHFLFDFYDLHLAIFGQS